MIVTHPNAQSRKLVSTKKERTRQVVRETFWGYLFLAPMAVLVLTFTIYPIIGSIRYTLYNWDGIGEPTQFVGLRHFQSVATDPLFWNAFGHTLTYAVVLVVVQLTLALILALILNNPRLHFSTFYRAVYFMPALMTTSVLSVVISLLSLSISSNFPQWMVDAKLVDPGLGIFNDPRLAFPAIIVFGIWQTLGYNMIYFLAALQSVPSELYEAAKIDGAGKTARFWYITIPMIRPVAVIIVLMAFLGSFGVFDQVYILTKGGPLGASDVVSTYIYRYAFEGSIGQTANYGFASAAAFFFSMLLLGLAIFQLRLTATIKDRRAALNLNDQAA